MQDVLFIEQRVKVKIDICWGCGRRRGPKLWASKAMQALARSEGRLVFGEYLCSHADCPANRIAG